MDFIEIDYNRDLKPLGTVLSGVKRHGDFFVSGAMEMPMPKVDVDGVGALSFPVPAAQIAALVRQHRGGELRIRHAGREVTVDTSAAEFSELSYAAFYADCEHEAEFLLALSEDPARCYPEVAEFAVAGLDRIGMRDAGPEDLHWEPDERRRPLGPRFLEDLLQALRRFATGTRSG